MTDQMATAPILRLDRPVVEFPMAEPEEKPEVMVALMPVPVVAAAVLPLSTEMASC